MTSREHLLRAIAEMTEQEASEVLELVESRRFVDIYGTPWGQVLDGVDQEVLRATGVPTITIPDGIPDVE